MAALSWTWQQLGKRIEALGHSVGLKRGLGNALYSILEYIALPVTMVIATPHLIHRLGIEEFGLWMLVLAIVGSMGTLSTGFGAATIKYVADFRGREDRNGIERVVRGTLTINLLLGAILATGLAIAAPAAVTHVFRIEPHSQAAAILAVRIGALLLVIRSAEGVFVSTLRAFEAYGPAVGLNVAGRVLTLAAAVFLTSVGVQIVGLMVLTFAIALVEALLQMILSNRIAGGICMLPMFKSTFRGELFNYGCLSWMQALAAIVFGYADRILVGALLGTSAVAYYTICVQATQPIHGLAAAGFNVLFPHLSCRLGTDNSFDAKYLCRWSIAANIGFSVLFSGLLAVFGNRVIAIWMGEEFASHTRYLFPLLALAFGALALNVVPYYALLALGHVRIVTILNVAGGAATLVLAVVLIPVFGLFGAAVARLLYGPITWISYLKLRQILRSDRLADRHLQPA